MFDDDTSYLCKVDYCYQINTYIAYPLLFCSVFELLGRTGACAQSMCELWYVFRCIRCNSSSS